MTNVAELQRAGMPMIELVTGVDVGVKYYARATMHLDHVNGAWRLRSADLVQDTEPLRMDCAGLPYKWRLVIERATVRQRDGHTKKREVENLLLAAGRLGAMHPSPEFQLPEEWKGQLKKKLDHKRTLERLSPDEIAILPKSKAELKHVLDAVGIAMKAVGRR